jgi:hypothetical protein
LGLCRCGRLHPCDDHCYWLGVRGHYEQFVAPDPNRHDQGG